MAGGRRGMSSVVARMMLAGPLVREEVLAERDLDVCTFLLVESEEFVAGFAESRSRVGTHLLE